MPQEIDKQSYFDSLKKRSDDSAVFFFCVYLLAMVDDIKTGKAKRMLRLKLKKV